jgi:hypothetical protein
MEYKQLERPNYFTGKLLTAADFEQEQQYHLDRGRRINRFLHGWGIVSGLNVNIENGAKLVVAPGLALDCAGNELVLTEPQCIALSNITGKHYLTICYTETPIGQMPSLEEAPTFSHIREGASVALSCTNPAADHRGMLAGTPGCGHAHALCIAAISQRGAEWRVVPARSSKLPRTRSTLAAGQTRVR